MVKGGLEHLVITSDIQDYGSAVSNLEVTRALFKYISEEFEDASVLLAGDFLDSHVGNSRYYEPEETMKQNLQLAGLVMQNLPEEQRKKFEEGIQKDPRLLLQLVANGYLAEFGNIVRSSRVNTYGFLGNNEPFLFGAVEKEAIDQFKEEIKEKLPFTYAEGFNEINGLNVYAAEEWAITNGEESLEYTRDDSNIEKSVIYQELKSAKEAPQVISLHGPPGIYENEVLGGTSEHKGIDKYINEYDGKEPLIVSFGHNHKPGHTITTNDAGSKVIYLCSNAQANGGENPKGVAYDIISKDGKVEEILQIDYGYIE